MAIHQYANNPQTALSGSVTAGATSISVASATGFPPQGKFTIIVDSEIMLVTGVTGTTWTVERGREGTTAAAHNNNATVTQVLTVDSFLNADHFDVRAFGARGDGSTDDYAAIQAALDAVPDGFSGAGGTVYLPPGNYRISQPLIVKTRGTRLTGAAGAYASTITPLAGFSIGSAPELAAIIVKMANTSGLPYGVNIDHLTVRLTDVNGVSGIVHYHHTVASMTNVWVTGVPSGANALRVKVDTDLVTAGFTDVSETAVWTNVFAHYRDENATGTLVRLDRCQEMVLIGCKFRANGPNGTLTTNTAKALHIDTPRGVTLIGCSTAFAFEHIRIENNHTGGSTSVGYVNIFGHTFEGALDSTARALIGNGATARLAGIYVVAPRYMNLNGAQIQLVDTELSDIDVQTVATTLDAASQQNIIRSRTASIVTDSAGVGAKNVIIASDDARATFEGSNLYRRTLSGRQDTASIAAGGSADVVVSWGSGVMPDTNYTVTLGLAQSAAAAGTIIANVQSRSTTGVTVRVKNNDSAARVVTVHVIAIAD